MNITSLSKEFLERSRKLKFPQFGKLICRDNSIRNITHIPQNSKSKRIGETIHIHLQEKKDLCEHHYSLDDSFPIYEDIRNFCKKNRFRTKDIKIAINNILDEKPLFFEKIGDWQEHTLGHQLHINGNENLRKSLERIRSDPCGGVFSIVSRTRCEKKIRRYILQQIKRIPKTLETRKGEKHLQQFFKKDKEREVFIANYAQASQVDKKLNPKSTGNTNLGSIITLQLGVKKRCLVTRSGRSNSLQRLEELIKFSAYEHLTAQDSRCLHRVVGEEDTYEFTHHITSYLDSSSVKSLASLPQKFFNIFRNKKRYIDDEKRQLQELFQALDEWDSSAIKEYKVVIDGKEKTLRLNKPIISNEIFSSMVRGIHCLSPISKTIPLGYDRRDQIEFINGIQLLYRAFEENILPVEMADMVKASCLNLPLDIQKSLFCENGVIDYRKIVYTDFLSDDSQLTQALSSKRGIAFQQEIERVVEKYSKEGLIASTAFYATIFRKNMGSPDQDVHPADIEIWRNYLDDLLGISKGKQCKSGTDRTGVGIALVWASSQFKADTEREFLPQQEKKEEDELRFKCLFYKALIEFGLSMTVETRGYSGLKFLGGIQIFGGTGNPVPHRYLLNDKDIKSPHLESLWKEYFPHKKPPKEPFVTLRQDQIEKGGLDQYMGKYTDSYFFTGKITGNFQKKSNLNSISEETKKKCIISLSHLFKHNSQEPLFNHNLNVQPHISQVSFSEEEILSQLVEYKKSLILEKKSEEKKIIQLKMSLLQQVLHLSSLYKKSCEVVCEKEISIFEVK